MQAPLHEDRSRWHAHPAIAFTEATDRAALITTIVELEEACGGRAGTLVCP